MTNKQIETLNKVIKHINSRLVYKNYYTLSEVYTNELDNDVCIVRLSFDHNKTCVLDECFSFMIGKRGGLFHYNDKHNREYLTIYDITTKCRIY